MATKEATRRATAAYKARLLKDGIERRFVWCSATDHEFFNKLCEDYATASGEKKPAAAAEMFGKLLEEYGNAAELQTRIDALEAENAELRARLPAPITPDSILAAAYALRFDGRKAFISAVWEAVARPGIALADFKAQLVEMNRAGALHLARLDMPETLTPAQHEQMTLSETANKTARFHCIIAPQAQEADELLNIIDARSKEEGKTVTERRIRNWLGTGGGQAERLFKLWQEKNRTA